MKVLQGIRVIDLTMWAFVPSAGGVMAHWGADVIKVESPRAPDPMRLLGGTLEPGAAAPLFKHYSRGKRAIALDLAHEEGRDLLYRMVKDADVFLTSYMAKTRRKLKFDLDDIRAINPNIIYAKGSGHGPEGPDAERGGYDGATWWCRGSLAQSTMDVTGIGFPSGMIGHGDGMSGMTLAGGICGALLHRERTGEALVVDASLMGTAIWFNGPAIISSGLGQDFVPPAMAAPRERRHPTINQYYRTGDDRFLIVLMLGDADDEWVDWVEHLGRPGMATDPRFATSAARVENSAAAVAIFDEVFAQHSLAEWRIRLATTKGVWAPIQKPVEMLDDPQTEANRFIQNVEYATGPIRLPAPPILFNREAGDVPPAPDFGQHTDEILGEVGVSADEIAGLRERGVVA